LLRGGEDFLVSRLGEVVLQGRALEVIRRRQQLSLSDELGAGGSAVRYEIKNITKNVISF